MEFLHPAGWKRPSGYSYGVAAEGRSIFVAGQIGADPATGQVVSDNFADQIRQALANTVAILAEGGAGAEHICAMTWFVTDRRAYLDNAAAVGAAYMDTVGKHFPAISLIEVKGLLDDRAMVEIETTAVMPNNSQNAQ